jgi:predicted RNase H-like nuclease
MDQIIGLDCATEDKRIGLARAIRGSSGWDMLEMFTCGRDRPVHEALERWLGEGSRSLLAIDAPLGWPEGLGRALATHRAGEEPKVPPDRMFRRETDRHVARLYKKTPLDVGADRIARTAHRAVTILSFLRLVTREPIPLAWDRPQLQRIAAIEVYPAATLRAYGISLAGYKKREGAPLRQRLADFIATRVNLQACPAPEDVGVDGLDAGVCVVAGQDFLSGLAVPPANPDLAGQEGWIWVREPLANRVGNAVNSSSESNGA